VIAESHIAIHSWPEHRCASVDIFSCGEKMNPQAVVDYLKMVFKAEKVEMRTLSRGEVASSNQGEKSHEIVP